MSNHGYIELIFQSTLALGSFGSVNTLIVMKIEPRYSECERKNKWYKYIYWDEDSDFVLEFLPSSCSIFLQLVLDR